MGRPLTTRSSRVNTGEPCKGTGKRKYRTELDAKIAMAGMSSVRAKREKRAYLCDDCQGWHTTAMSQNEYDARRR